MLKKTSCFAIGDPFSDETIVHSTSLLRTRLALSLRVGRAETITH